VQQHAVNNDNTTNSHFTCKYERKNTCIQ